MGPDGFARAGEQRPPFADLVIDHFVEDEAVYVEVGGPVFFGSEEEAGVEHADEDFGVLPEFFFAVVDAAAVRAFDVDAAVVVVDTVGEGMVEGFADEGQVGFEGDVGDLEGVV